ncbi:MAG: cellulase family glycosylhydrolase [Fibrobacter sp.]|nr:cellulase family glycosylhydrolase [Fibrobacter sp.]
MKKTLFWVLAFCLVSLSFGRVGPVSQYGQLLAGKNSAGQGRIYGSCQGVKSGSEVQVQGMSLFWSIAGDVGDFWNSSTVTGLVQRQNIQIIRAAMGVDENWGSGNYFTDQSKYQGMMDAVVQAAIDNDIYVIIDYHSHKASADVNSAKTFFSRMAQKWGGYDNVIFEVFNEPTSQSWNEIRTYANAVVATIRQYSDNLVLVGNPSWDQFPNYAINNEVTDSKNNIAYTFHFYAGSHSTGNEGSHAVSAMNSGLSVFVSEWGTVNADGDGGVSGNASTWLNWMNQYKLSGANWAVSTKGEGASYFNGSAWNYSESGKWVNSNIFSKLPTSYTGCSAGPQPASSSSVKPNSSASQPSSSASTTKKYALVDDLEDKDEISLWGGKWDVYNDNSNQAQSKSTMSFVNGNASNGAIQMDYTLNKGGYEFSPFVGIVVDVNADGETTEDLSKCTSIQYDYKGAAHSFRVENPSEATGYNYYQIAVDASNSWTTKRVSWTSLKQQTGWGTTVSLDYAKQNVRAFSWQIEGSTGDKGTLQIDNVKCVGLPEAPVSSSSAKSSSSSAVSSSSSAISSSSVPPPSSSSNAIYNVDGDLVQTVARNTAINTVTISGVTSFTRNSWNAYFLDFKVENGTLTISGIVPDYFNANSAIEKFTVNGDKLQLELTITAAASSSSVSSSSSTPTYTVIWKNADGVTLETDEGVLEGTVPSYDSAVPTLAPDAQYTYTFDSWDPEVMAANSDATYMAVYAKVLNKYTVTWKNGNTTLETDKNVVYGTTPEYNGATPTKSETAQFSYTFAGWTPEVAAVTGAATYSAVFDATVRSYVVTFKNYNDKVLQAVNVKYGETPKYTGYTPEKPADAEYTYEFEGWSPKIGAVTGEATYTAQFKGTLIPVQSSSSEAESSSSQEQSSSAQTVSSSSEVQPSSSTTIADMDWHSNAGLKNESETGVIVEQSEPYASPRVVTKVVGNVENGVDYVFSFDVFLTPWGDDMDMQVVLGSYCDEPTTLTKGKERTFACTFKATASEPVVLTLTMPGNRWEPVTISNMSLKANLGPTTHTVFWKNDDGTVLETDKNVAEGDVPEYNGATPAKAATAQFSYTFAGWEESVAASGDVTYTATFDAILRKYTVSWVNENGNEISSAQVEYGTMPAFDGEQPSKFADAQYSYTFAGWTPDVVAVGGDAIYTAKFNKTLRSYTVTWKNENGNVLEMDASVDYGATPKFDGAIPTKPADDQYTYTFADWDPKVSVVKGNVTYTATYSAEAIPVVSSSSELIEESSSSEGASSSSEQPGESSSSEESSSAANGVVVSGDLQQEVVKGGEFQTVTFSNVESFDRGEWEIYWILFDPKGGELVVTQSPYNKTNDLQPGSVTETFTVNGTQYEIKVTVVEPKSSSSANSPRSSSSSGYDIASCNSNVYSSSAGGVVPASNGSETPASDDPSTLALRGAVKFPVSVGLNGRVLQVAGGQATIDVFDMQGRPLARFDQVSGAIGLEMLNSGNYILRIRSGGQVQNRRIMLK